MVYTIIIDEGKKNTTLNLVNYSLRSLFSATSSFSGYLLIIFSSFFLISCEKKIDPVTKKAIKNHVGIYGGLQKLSQKFPEDVKKIEIMPGGFKVKKIPPIPIGEKYAFFMNKPKQEQIITLPPLYAYELRNVILYRPVTKKHDQSVAISKSGKFSVSDYMDNNQEKRLEKLIRNFNKSGNKIHKVKCGILPAFYFGWNNAYHYFYQFLPFSYLLRDYCDKQSLLLKCNSPNKYFDELQESIFPKNRTLFIRKLSKNQNNKKVIAFEFEKLFAIHINEMLSRSDVFNLTRKIILDKFHIIPQKKLRLYISRDDAKYRRIINESQLMNCLKKYGFIKVILTGMPLEKQVKLFSNAEIVIGSHGAGMGYISFCPKSADIVEMMYPLANFSHGCFWEISNSVGLNYYYLVGELNDKDKKVDVPKSSKEFGKSIYREHCLSTDFKVSVEKIDKWLKERGYNIICDKKA